MNDWIDMIDRWPELDAVDERDDWQCSGKLYVMDTFGNEAIATYYIKRDFAIEKWWECDNDIIDRRLIRYWRSAEIIDDDLFEDEELNPDAA